MLLSLDFWPFSLFYPSRPSPHFSAAPPSRSRLSYIPTYSSLPARPLSLSSVVFLFIPPYFLSFCHTDHDRHQAISLRLWTPLPYVSAIYRIIPSIDILLVLQSEPPHPSSNPPKHVMLELSPSLTFGSLKMMLLRSIQIIIEPYR